MLLPESRRCEREGKSDFWSMDQRAGIRLPPGTPSQPCCHLLAWIMTGAKWICSARDYPRQPYEPPLEGILIIFASFCQGLVKYLRPHHLIVGCDFMKQLLSPLWPCHAPSGLSFSMWPCSKTSAGWKVWESCTVWKMLSSGRRGPELLSLT